MAERALKKVEDQLNCSICLDTYSDPKLLQCFHVYCQKCLVKLVVRDQGQLALTCPICRQVTPVPANGVAGLQPAFHINYFLEIVEEHKKVAADPSDTEEVERDSTSLTPHDKFKICCPEHGGKEVELYCDTCGLPICWKCAIKGGKHHSHDYEELHKAFEKYKVEITASLQPMEKQLATIEKALSKLDSQCTEICGQQAAIEADVHSTFGQLQEILEARRCKVIDQLHQITQGKLKVLAVQRDQIETIQAQLSSCVQFMRESLQSDRKGEVLMTKTAVFKQANELTTTFPPDVRTEADLVFSVSKDVTTLCQKYGQLLTPSMPDPSKCHATGEGTQVATVGETATAIIQANNCMGEPCREPIKLSECELVSEITGTRARGSIERRGQSQYEISYQPTIKGRHQLHIKVEDQHIRGSPFSVAVKSPANKFHTPIQTMHGVMKPRDVIINHLGEVVTTEQGSDRISVFSLCGKKLRSFGTRGSDQGQFKCPSGLTLDGEGNILVADCHNHRIQKFTAEGYFLKAVGSEACRPLEFRYPKGVAFNATNNKVYVTNDHLILVLNSDLTFSFSFGENHGLDEGEFSYPCGIACDSSGKVYVADYCNHRIQIFTAEGKFLRMFGAYGEGKGELIDPIDIAIDTRGMLFVSEHGNLRVSVFNSDCEFVTFLDNHLLSPYGLFVDSSGVLCVCDYADNSVQLL